MQSYKNYRIQRTVTLLFFQRANHKHSKYSLTTIKEQKSQQKNHHRENPALPQRKLNPSTVKIKQHHSKNHPIAQSTKRTE